VLLREMHTAPKQQRGRFCVARTCCAIRITRVGSLLLLLLLRPRPVYIGIPNQLQGSRRAAALPLTVAAALIYC